MPNEKDYTPGEYTFLVTVSLVGNSDAEQTQLNRLIAKFTENLLNLAMQDGSAMLNVAAVEDADPPE